MAARVPVGRRELLVDDGDGSKESRWMLTLNTNRPYSDNLATRFRNFLRECFSEEGYERIVSFRFRLRNGRWSQHHRAGAWGPQYIRAANAEYSLEQGKKFNRLHSHVVVRIIHWSQIRLDYKEIKAIAAEHDIEGLYVNGRIIPSARIVFKYLRKDLPPRPIDNLLEAAEQARVEENNLARAPVLNQDIRADTNRGLRP